MFTGIVEPHRDKALAALSRERGARQLVDSQIVAGGVAPDVEPPSDKAFWASRWESHSWESFSVRVSLGKILGELLEELLFMSKRTVAKLLWSCWESLCWSNYRASKLLRSERVIVGIVALYVELPNDKALGKSLYD
jgi:hypothetical protein